MRSITLVVKYVDLKQTYYILFIHIRYASYDLQAFYSSNYLKLLPFMNDDCHILINLSGADEYRGKTSVEEICFMKT